MIQDDETFTDEHGILRRRTANGQLARVLSRKEANRVLHRIENGMTLKGACTAVGLATHWVNAEMERQPGFKARLVRARARAAESRIEKADAELDQAAERTIGEGANERIDPASVSLAQARANHHRWVAGKMDRKNWGDETNVNVQGAIAHLVVGGSLGERGQSERSDTQGVPNKPADADGPEVIELVEDEEGQWVDPSDDQEGGVG